MLIVLFSGLASSKSFRIEDEVSLLKAREEGNTRASGPFRFFPSSSVKEASLVGSDGGGEVDSCRRRSIIRDKWEQVVFVGEGMREEDRGKVVRSDGELAGRDLILALEDEVTKDRSDVQGLADMLISLRGKVTRREIEGVHQSCRKRREGGGKSTNWISACSHLMLCGTL